MTYDDLLTIYRDFIGCRGGQPRPAGRGLARSRRQNSAEFFQKFRGPYTRAGNNGNCSLSILMTQPSENFRRSMYFKKGQISSPQSQNFRGSQYLIWPNRYTKQEINMTVYSLDEQMDSNTEIQFLPTLPFSSDDLRSHREYSCRRPSRAGSDCLRSSKLEFGASSSSRFEPLPSKAKSLGTCMSRLCALASRIRRITSRGKPQTPQKPMIIEINS